MNYLTTKRENEKGQNLVKMIQMLESKRYLLQKLNRRAIQLRRRKRNCVCRNYVTYKIKRET
jgi:nanoRNase/pAp phosphatase (c-di-AMP/oligoRNAs hydrolase)